MFWHFIDKTIHQENNGATSKFETVVCVAAELAQELLKSLYLHVRTLSVTLRWPRPPAAPPQTCCRSSQGTGTASTSASRCREPCSTRCRGRSRAACCWGSSRCTSTSASMSSRRWLRSEWVGEEKTTEVLWCLRYSYTEDFVPDGWIRAGLHLSVRKTCVSLCCSGLETLPCRRSLTWRVCPG